MVRFIVHVVLVGFGSALWRNRAHLLGAEGGDPARRCLDALWRFHSWWRRAMLAILVLALLAWAVGLAGPAGS